MKGDWCVAYDSFAKDDLQGMTMEQEDAQMKGTEDMTKRGILIA